MLPSSAWIMRKQEISQAREYNAGKKSCCLPTHEKTFKEGAALVLRTDGPSSQDVLTEGRKAAEHYLLRCGLPALLYLVSTWPNLYKFSLPIQEIDQTEMILGSRRHLRAQWFMNISSPARGWKKIGACEQF